MTFAFRQAKTANARMLCGSFGFALLIWAATIKTIRRD
jgi:hypothetical protein